MSGVSESGTKKKKKASPAPPSVLSSLSVNIVSCIPEGKNPLRLRPTHKMLEKLNKSQRSITLLWHLLCPRQQFPIDDSYDSWAVQTWGHVGVPPITDLSTLDNDQDLHNLFEAMQRFPPVYFNWLMYFFDELVKNISEPKDWKAKSPFYSENIRSALPAKKAGHIEEEYGMFAEEEERLFFMFIYRNTGRISLIGKKKIVLMRIHRESRYERAVVFYWPYKSVKSTLAYDRAREIDGTVTEENYRTWYDNVLDKFYNKIETYMFDAYRKNSWFTQKAQPRIPRWLVSHLIVYFTTVRNIEKSFGSWVDFSRTPASEVTQLSNPEAVKMKLYRDKIYDTLNNIVKDLRVNMSTTDHPQWWPVYQLYTPEPVSAAHHKSRAKHFLGQIACIVRMVANDVFVSQGNPKLPEVLIGDDEEESEEEEEEEEKEGGESNMVFEVLAPGWFIVDDYYRISKEDRAAYENSTVSLLEPLCLRGIEAGSAFVDYDYSNDVNLMDGRFVGNARYRYVSVKQAPGDAVYPGEHALPTRPGTAWYTWYNRIPPQYLQLFAHHYTDMAKNDPLIQTRVTALRESGSVPSTRSEDGEDWQALLDESDAEIGIQQSRERMKPKRQKRRAPEFETLPEEHRMYAIEKRILIRELRQETPPLSETRIELYAEEVRQRMEELGVLVGGFHPTQVQIAKRQSKARAETTLGVRDRALESVMRITTKLLVKTSLITISMRARSNIESDLKTVAFAGIIKQTLARGTDDANWDNAYRWTEYWIKLLDEVIFGDRNEQERHGDGGPIIQKMEETLRSVSRSILRWKPDIEKWVPEVANTIKTHFVTEFKRTLDSFDDRVPKKWREIVTKVGSMENVHPLVHDFPDDEGERLFHLIFDYLFNYVQKPEFVHVVRQALEPQREGEVV